MHVCVYRPERNTIQEKTFMGQNTQYTVHSGVTRVVITRGGNWWVSLFFFQKNLMTFLVIFFSCRLLTSPIFPRRLSSVLSKFSHDKNNFRSGVTPLEGVTRGGRPSPCPTSDATDRTPDSVMKITTLHTNEYVYLVKRKTEYATKS